MSGSETYLVTGAMGCLGAWTLRHLVAEGRRVISFDLSEERGRINLLMSPEEQEHITFLKGDLSQAEAVARPFQDYEITHVIHLAALQVPFCRANPVLGAQVNVVGTVNIFEAARAAGLKHVTYASSIAVYGPKDDYPPGPLPEDAPTSPRTLYGVYKVANEQQARVYWHEHGMSSTALRPYTVYGVGRDQGLTSDPTKAMLAAAAGKPYEIGFGGTMQMQWASDVARQFIDAARMRSEGAHVFNLGTKPVSIPEVIQLIHELVPAAKVTYRENALPFPESFDAQALHSHMQTVHETPLREGIRQTIGQFKKLLADGKVSA